MAEYTRDNSGMAGGTGPAGTGGTGYTGGTGGMGTPGGYPRDPDRDREPRSSAAIWIVGIVVVVGALAIWIARNTVDETDQMQGRPGVDRTDVDRDLDRTGAADPYGATKGTHDRSFENPPGEQGSFGTDVPTSSGTGSTGDRGTLDGQQGTGSIRGSSTEDRRFENDDPGTGTHGTGTMGTQGGGTGTVGGGTQNSNPGTGSDTDQSGVSTDTQGGTNTGTTGTTGTTGQGTGTSDTSTGPSTTGTDAGTGTQNTGTTTP